MYYTLLFVVKKNTCLYTLTQCGTLAFYDLSKYLMEGSVILEAPLTQHAQFCVPLTLS